MIKHKPKTKKPIIIGHETYTVDDKGFVFLPYEYKIYNPVKEKKKKKA